MKKKRSYQLKFVVFCLLFLAPWFMGASRCNGFVKKKRKLTYIQGAKQLYTKGQKYLKNSNFEYARKNFQRLKTKFPFSRYATLAEIGIANSYFNDTKYLQAIDAYKLFEKLHPTHPKTPYAVYRVAMSYYKLRPWNVFFLPASFEKDATSTRQAIHALKIYLKRYPKHKQVKKAQKYLKICISQLVKHEIHVADFYAKRGKYMAVAWRMSYLLKKYPKTTFAPRAHYKMIDAYVRLKQKKSAENTLIQLTKKYPKSKYVALAKKALSELIIKPQSHKAINSKTPIKLRAKKQPPSSKKTQKTKITVQ